MMIYIPEDWLINKNNKSEVYKIFKKHTPSDLIAEDEPDPLDLAIKELEKIGETTVIKKIREGNLITTLG